MGPKFPTVVYSQVFAFPLLGRVIGTSLVDVEGK